MSAATEHAHSVNLTPEGLAAPWVAAHLQKRWLLVAGLAGAASLGGLVYSMQSTDPNAMQHFFRAYLVGFMFIMGLTLGSMALLMLQHVTGGKWGLIIRRILEAGAGTIWLGAAFFVGLCLGLKFLYPWMDPSGLTVHGEHAYHIRHAYLNAGGFILRGAIFFAGWAVFIHFMRKWSLELEKPAASHEEYERLRLRFMRLGSGGLLFYAITISLAAVDWVMSLDAVWYSTIWGLLYMGGQALLALSFTVIIMILLARYEPFKGLLRTDEMHDVGKLLLALVMLYTYLSFSQFIIIWSGNLQEEVTWYLARVRHGWKPVIVGLAIFHFALPFLLLLNRDLKKNGSRLAKVALLLVLARLVDIFWHVVPNFRDAAWPDGHFFLTPWDLIVPLAMASAWLAYFFFQLRQRTLLPAHHHLVPELLEKGHGGH